MLGLLPRPDPHHRRFHPYLLAPARRCEYPSLLLALFPLLGKASFTLKLASVSGVAMLIGAGERGYDLVLRPTAFLTLVPSVELNDPP